MVRLDDLHPADAERLVFAMQHVETTGPLGYHVTAELLPFLRKGVKQGELYHRAALDRFELITGHALPPDGRMPPLH